MNKTELFKAVIDEIGSLHQSLLNFYNALTSNQEFEVIDEPEDAAPLPTVTLS